MNRQINLLMRMNNEMTIIEIAPGQGKSELIIAILKMKLSMDPTAKALILDLDDSMSMLRHLEDIEKYKSRITRVEKMLSSYTVRKDFIIEQVCYYKSICDPKTNLILVLPSYKDDLSMSDFLELYRPSHIISAFQLSSYDRRRTIEN